MRWAIRRLKSRGKSEEKPRAVRDSETIQDTTAQTSLGPAPLPHPSRKPPRQAGQRWPHARPPKRRCRGRHTCGPQNDEKHQQPSVKPWRVEKVPSLSETGHTPGNPYSRTTISSRRRGAKRETKAGVRDRGELRHRGAHHIANSVVPQNLVAAATTREGMGTPAVPHLATQGARGIVIPERQTKTALESSAK